MSPSYIQAWSAQQRFVIVLLFVSILPKRAENISISNWSWAIPLVGISWVGAELVYFLALTYPEAKVAYLAVFRRTSLIVGFTISALYFGERNVIWKCVMVLGLVCGISIVIVG